MTSMTLGAHPCAALRRRTLIAAVLAGFAPAGAALAQDLPIRIIVSLPAGGGVDTVARYLGQQLGEALGRTVVIENRPGGSGTIAAKAVIGAPKHQTVLLTGGNQEITIAPHLLADPAYRPMDALAPLLQVGTVPSVVVAAAGAHANQDAFVRALAGGSAAIGTPGVGTPMHIALEDVARRSGGKFLHVPYKGAPDVLAGVLSGATPYGAVGFPAARNLLESGRLVPISVLAQTRSDLLPNTPAIAEKVALGQSLPEVWYGFFAPSTTSADEKSRIEDAFATLMRQDAVRKRLQDLGMRVTALNGAKFRPALQAESDYYRHAVVAYKVQ